MSDGAAPPRFLTSALYKFVRLPDHAALREPLLATCTRHGVRGTLLLAPEGINGTIAGAPEGVRAVLAWLRADARLADLEDKQSWSDTPPFERLKVRLKAEIVSLRVPGVNPSEQAGQYVDARDWNRLLEDPALVLVDTRNDYEVAIGSFAGALNPGTRSFSELPAWVQAQSQEGGALAERNGRKPRVAMFCTGGIRCEKSTALLRQQGFDEVYHLRGGILKYLETVPAAESHWQGECFVFDERVSVGQGLQPGGLQLCRSCGRALDARDRASPLYREGVSCASCHGRTSAAQKSGFAERQRQHERAQVGPPVLEDPVQHLRARLAAMPPNQRLLIGLAGEPGSGKSTWATSLANRVNSALGTPCMLALGMDGFHLSRAALARMPDPQMALERRGAPWTFDAQGFAARLRTLRAQDAQGRLAEQRWPDYAHGVGDPVADAIAIPPGVRLLLVEGLYLLHSRDGWQLDGLLDERWYLDTPPALARERLQRRHMAAWGMTAAQAKARIHANDALNARTVRASRACADWLVRP